MHLKPYSIRAVNTQTQEQYDILMQVLECGRWRRLDDYLPTKMDSWLMHAKNTCVDVDPYIFGGKIKFGIGNKESMSSLINGGRILIPLNDFCDYEGITPTNLQEINEYFAKRGK